MKSLTEFVRCVLEDLGTRCGTSTTRDHKTITRRVEDEGVSFLTLTLPNFCSDLQKGLEQGFVAHDQFPGFARTGGLPRFLGGFLELIFDRKTGRLLDDPSIDAIFSVRQITLMFGKIALPCAPHRVDSAIAGYIQCEKEVRLHDLSFDSVRDDFVRVAMLLWADVLSVVDHAVHDGRLTPRHGPGATADGLRGNSKFLSKVWTHRLERSFPLREFLFPNDHPSYWDEMESIELLEPGSEIPVKVITVPKTLKSPRIIAMEPTHVMYMQQALLEVIADEIPRHDFSREFIKFDDQTPNQVLAKQGSMDGSLATLDLSEASDRVSNQHVRALLSRFPDLHRAVDDTRSRKADVPGYGVVRLAKFASMGSALCFPMEAMVFATVVFIGIERTLNRRLTKADVYRYFGRVRVFGDDIIVPKECVSSVVEELETFGFRVNRRKSFWNGQFRESCGKDYYAGSDVSITRVRSTFPHSRKDASAVASTVSLRNQLFLAGFGKAVTYLDDMLEGLIPFPHVEPTSPLLGRLTHGPLPGPDAFDRNLHHPLVRGAYVSSVPPASPLDGTGAMMKWFLKRGTMPFADKDHLMRSGRPRSVRIKIGLRRPY